MGPAVDSHSSSGVYLSVLNHPQTCHTLSGSGSACTTRARCPRPPGERGGACAPAV